MATSRALQRNWIDESRRDDVLTGLLTLPETRGLSYLGSMEVKQAIWDIAAAVGKIRNISNEVLRSHGRLSAYHRGDKQERYAVIGSVGDVLISNLFYKHPELERAALADVGPSKALDLTHTPTGLEVDVKSSEGKSFNINRASHASKPCGAYLLVHLPVDTVADLYACRYDAVDGTWRLCQSRYNSSEYYSMPVPQGLEALVVEDEDLVPIDAAA